MCIDSYPYLVRIENGSFTCGYGEFGPVLFTRVTGVRKFLVKDALKGFIHSSPYDGDSCVPDGWALSYSLDIRCGGDSFLLVIGEDVIERSFIPYEQHLKETCGLGVEDVYTVITLQTSSTGELHLQFTHADWCICPSE